MVQEQLEVLEARVQEMIELIKKLKREKEGLEAKVNEQAREFRQLQEERGEVRLRIERILGTLNHLEIQEPLEEDSEIPVKVKAGEE
ncbi:cell division protein ZapB [Candidatus Manganitrophus noduliformans]|uniref:Cell division protein ZapB n=1 Tax=Candidatus Manganitrophus noduliformans TaxID=2606439 RepID=A0A7X6DQC5_9BACT|nr:cell division protein ZapB [Candidatus Manganitrophus noduliformans]NKE71431.1 cell division protein ZapB [Candidatus Manganitrophus noduliformans]